MKKIRKSIEEMPLEGGGGGSGGGGGIGKFVDRAVPAATLAGMVGAGATIKNAQIKHEQQRKEEEKREDEAAAELKRESQRGMKKGGMVGSASKRADGIAQRGRTRGKMV